MNQANKHNASGLNTSNSSARLPKEAKDTQLDEILVTHGGRSITYYENYKRLHHNHEHYKEDRLYADAMAEKEILAWHNRKALQEVLALIGEYKPQKNKWGKITAPLASDNLVRKAMIERLRKAAKERYGDEQS